MVTVGEILNLFPVPKNPVALATKFRSSEGHTNETQRRICVHQPFQLGLSEGESRIQFD